MLVLEPTRPSGFTVCGCCAGRGWVLYDAATNGGHPPRRLRMENRGGGEMVQAVDCPECDGDGVTPPPLRSSGGI